MSWGSVDRSPAISHFLTYALLKRFNLQQRNELLLLYCWLWPLGLATGVTTIKFRHFKMFGKWLSVILKNVTNLCSKILPENIQIILKSKFQSQILTDLHLLIHHNTYDVHTCLSSDDVHSDRRCIQSLWGDDPGTEDGMIVNVLISQKKKKGFSGWKVKFHSVSSCSTIVCHHWSSCETDELLIWPVCGSPHLLTPCSLSSSWLPAAPPEA